jgi:hypothetical protein
MHLLLLIWIIQWLHLSFIRLVHDWKVDVLASFYTLLYSHKMRREREDKIWWVPSRKGKFDVRSFYKILTHNETICFPWRSIWRTKAPSRVTFFVWMAVLRKVLTLDNLRKRQLIVINRCCLYKSDGETVDHILLHGEVASALWYAFLSRFGLSWVMPNNVADLFACWWTGGRLCSAMV